MSAYPTCSHGFSDPNFDCPQCKLETERDKLRAESAEWKRRHDNAVNMLHTAEEDCTKLRAEVERLNAEKAELELLIETARNYGASLALHSAQEERDAAMKGDE